MYSLPSFPIYCYRPLAPFIVPAYGFIRCQQVEWHRRFMISIFICAVYFVTVRVVDKFAMGLFRAVTKDEAVAMLISDISVWLVPVVIFWTAWLHADFVNKPGWLLKIFPIR